MSQYRTTGVPDKRGAAIQPRLIIAASLLGRRRKRVDRCGRSAADDPFSRQTASASKANRARTERDSRDYRDDDFRDRDDPRYRDNSAYSDPRAYDGREETARYDSGAAGSSDEDAAVDACALAARDEGSRNGYFAEVRDITDTRRTNDGGYTVLGTLDQRSSYRGANGLPRAFSCSWSDGEARVRLS